MRERGYAFARLGASINTVGFYQKIDYVAQDNMKDDNL